VCAAPPRAEFRGADPMIAPFGNPMVRDRSTPLSVAPAA
jgi:hypothetical protein